MCQRTNRSLKIRYSRSTERQCFPNLYAESALRLAEFFLEQISSILEEWEKFARTVEPAASVMTSKELRNHASVMLKSIASDLSLHNRVKRKLQNRMGKNLKQCKPTLEKSMGLHA